MSADDLMRRLDSLGSPARAAVSQRFFKTGKGQYGEGDQFNGASVPAIRKACREFTALDLDEIGELFASPVHEHRLAAAILLAEMSKKAGPKELEKIFKAYMKALAAGRINNWDIVDCSANYVVGGYYLDKDKSALLALARSDNLWEKRVAMLANFLYIVSGDSRSAFAVIEVLKNDPHDLLQKAVGWMLREIGKRVSRDELIAFLDKNAATLPRTTLRYAIEHLSPEQRQHYLSMKNPSRRLRK